MFPTLLVMGAILLALWSGPSQAHDIYIHLRNSRGVKCCDGSDCRPAHYRWNGRLVEMQIDGKWFTIHDDLITFRSIEGDDGTTRGGHWCGKHQIGSTWDYLQTHCAFLPPKLTSTNTGNKEH